VIFLFVYFAERYFSSYANKSGLDAQESWPEVSKYSNLSPLPRFLMVNPQFISRPFLNRAEKFQTRI